MQTICKKDTAYLSYIPENHRQYIKFIKLVLKNTDKICFTVKPFLDNLEEFAQSIWGFMCDSVLYTTCEQAITDRSDTKSHLIMLKNT